MTVRANRKHLQRLYASFFEFVTGVDPAYAFDDDNAELDVDELEPDDGVGLTPWLAYQEGVQVGIALARRTAA